MYIVDFLLPALSGVTIGGMAAAAAVVSIAKFMHRDELARRIARSVSKATWALRMGGAQSEYEA